jgi:hypothetical protein
MFVLLVIHVQISKHCKTTRALIWHEKHDLLLAPLHNEKHIYIDIALLFPWIVTRFSWMFKINFFLSSQVKHDVANRVHF